MWTLKWFIFYGFASFFLSLSLCFSLSDWCYFRCREDDMCLCIVHMAVMDHGHRHCYLIWSFHTHTNNEAINNSIGQWWEATRLIAFDSATESIFPLLQHKHNDASTRNEGNAYNVTMLRIVTHKCQTFACLAITLSSGPTFFRLFILLVYSQSQFLFLLSIATHQIISSCKVLPSKRDDRRFRPMRVAVRLCHSYFLLLHFNKMQIDGDRKNVCVCVWVCATKLGEQLS